MHKIKQFSHGLRQYNLPLSRNYYQTFFSTSNSEYSKLATKYIMNKQVISLDASIEALAKEAADFIKTLGNQHRLLVLCLLVEKGELNVGQIHQHSSLSQSALSQHIAIMRDEGLISYRREAQTLYYHITDDRVFKIVSALKDIFCP